MGVHQGAGRLPASSTQLHHTVAGHTALSSCPEQPDQLLTSSGTYWATANAIRMAHVARHWHITAHVHTNEDACSECSHVLYLGDAVNELEVGWVINAPWWAVVDGEDAIAVECDDVVGWAFRGLHSQQHAPAPSTHDVHGSVCAANRCAYELMHTNTAC